MPPDPGREARVRRFLEDGAEYVGAAGGAGIGLLGGPEAAVGGALAGTALAKLVGSAGADLYTRMRTDRQRERVAKSLNFMLDDATARAELGRTVRQDGFFAPNATGRSDGEEVFEALLGFAADEYEERKLRHLSVMFSAAATRTDIASADALWMIDAAHRMSWRQLVAVAAIATAGELGESDARSSTAAFRSEIEELGRLGFLGVLATGDKLVRAGGTFDTQSSIFGAPFERWRLLPMAFQLVEVAQLEGVDVSERREILAALRYREALPNE